MGIVEISNLYKEYGTGENKVKALDGICRSTRFYAQRFFERYT